MKLLKRMIGLFLGLFLLIGLTACGQPSTTESDSGSEDATTEETSDTEEDTSGDSTEGQTVSFMIPDWGAPSDELLAEFEESSGITVDLQPTSWDDIHNKVTTAAAGGNAAADVFEVDWAWMGEFTSAGWLEPLDISQETIDDMPTLETFHKDGSYYAVPYANDFRIAYYNQEMFNDAGIEELPETWNQVIADSEVIKEAGVVDYPVSIPSGAEENSTTTFLWLTMTRSGQTFNEDGTLNEEAAADALALYEELYAKDLVDPALTNASGMDAYYKITLGEASTMIGPSSFVNRIESEEDSQVVGEVQPGQLPGIDALAENTVPFTEAVGVSAQSENKEAAIELVKWYTSSETQEKLHEELSQNPPRISLLEKLNEEGKMGDHGDVFLDMSQRVESPFPNGVPSYYTQMSTVIFNTVNQLVSGNLTAEEATEQMVTEVNAIVEAEAE